MSLSGRAAYRDELTHLAAANPSILCLEADLGGTKHPFQARFPERFLNLGIAELAGLDVAAGLAANGFIPFISTFAPFAVLRAAEGVKLNMGYMGLNIKLVAPYAGVSGAWFGTTHHCLEDLAVLQSIPGITIAAPYGEEETRSVVRHAAATAGPFYIRLGRNDALTSFDEQAANTRNGVLWHMHRPARLCLVSVGERGTQITLQALKMRPDVAHAHLSYLDAAHLTLAAAELGGAYTSFLVVEEHRFFGGVASSLALLMPESQVRVHSCGFSWPHTGGEHEDVLNVLGFGREALLRQIGGLLDKTQFNSCDGPD